MKQIILALAFIAAAAPATARRFLEAEAMHKAGLGWLVLLTAFAILAGVIAWIERRARRGSSNPAKGSEHHPT